MNTECPTEYEIARFIGFDNAAAEDSSILEHIATCRECRLIIEQHVQIEAGLTMLDESEKTISKPKIYFEPAETETAAVESDQPDEPIRIGKTKVAAPSFRDSVNELHLACNALFRLLTGDDHLRLILEDVRELLEHPSKLESMAAALKSRTPVQRLDLLTDEASEGYDSLWRLACSCGDLVDSVQEADPRFTIAPVMVIASALHLSPEETSEAYISAFVAGDIVLRWLGRPAQAKAVRFVVRDASRIQRDESSGLWHSV